MKIEALLERLTNVRSRGTGKWSACCPSHDDQSPSLSICREGSKILVHCFSGCAPKDIVEALSLTMADLFTDCPGTPNQQRAAPRKKLDLADVAFRFELGALDRRLRAERVLRTAENIRPDELSDQQLDRLLNAIAGSYADVEHAELLETVADDLRMKAYQERTARHAA